MFRKHLCVRKAQIELKRWYDAIGEHEYFGTFQMHVVIEDIQRRFLSALILGEQDAWKEEPEMEEESI